VCRNTPGLHDAEAPRNRGYSGGVKALHWAKVCDTAAKT
jgi:hypothetical protein